LLLETACHTGKLLRDARFGFAHKGPFATRKKCRA
jgi:hypothetical protein